MAASAIDEGRYGEFDVAVAGGGMAGIAAAIAAALGERWRGEGWNDHQVRMLLEQQPSSPQNPSATPSSR